MPGIIENYISLDARKLKRDGLLKVGLKYSVQYTGLTIIYENIDPAIWLSYQKNDKNQHYPIRVETTPCNYGSVRYWFRCPANGCNRRVAILYLAWNIFACRHCYHLSYRIENETKHSRLFTNADRIRARLGWEGGIANGKGAKPKGMHWKTFERLQNKHDQLAEQASAMSLDVLLKQRMHNM